MAENDSMINRLAEFYRNLKNYQAYRTIRKAKGLSEKQYREMMDLREWLVQETGALGPFIIEITGMETVPIVIGSKEYPTHIWTVGLFADPVRRTPTALGYCIDATGQAIGKLEDDIKRGKRDKQGNVIGEPPKDTAELPVNLFDRMQFHSRVITASKSLFRDGHYASAILEAYKAVNNFVKEKTNLALDGKALMSKVFNEDAPVIKLNELLTQSDRDEQEGFKFLFMGAMVGIRNPKAHDDVIQTDPYRTLEYLGFASLLMKRIEEGKVVKLQKNV